MAKKQATKKTTSKTLKVNIKGQGLILPHGYEIRKAKRKTK
jgi:hypothetical protein